MPRRTPWSSSACLKHSSTWHKPSFTSRDTITITAAPGGSSVHYDARLEFSGVGRLFDPRMQLLFNLTGAKAPAGIRNPLNPRRR